MNRSVTILCSISMIAGCTLIRPATTSWFPPPTLIGIKSVRQIPAAGAVATAQIGQAMFATYNVVDAPAVRIDAPVRHVGKYREGLQMALDVQPGVLVAQGDDGLGGRFYYADSGIRLAYESKGEFPNPESFRGGLHHHSNGIWSVFWFWPGHSTPVIERAPELQFKTETVELPLGKTGFRRELVYSGTSQSTLSLLYREFIDDMARPAFSQDLKYDFAKGSVIGYKGARFEIQNADNTSITFRVLALLEDVKP